VPGKKKYKTPHCCREHRLTGIFRKPKLFEEWSGIQGSLLNPGYQTTSVLKGFQWLKRKKTIEKFLARAAAGPVVQERYHPISPGDLFCRSTPIC